eukprot:PhM_4_TR14174/c0_g1_i1/m.47437
MSDFGYQYICLNSRANKKKTPGLSGGGAGRFSPTKFDVTPSEEGILTRLNDAGTTGNYSPYMMYVPTATSNNNPLSGNVRNQQKRHTPSPSPNRLLSSLVVSPEHSDDIDMRKEARTRRTSYVRVGEKLCEDKPNMALIVQCLSSSCRPLDTLKTIPSEAFEDIDPDFEKIFSKPDFISAMEVLGITNRVFLETFFAHADGEMRGFILYSNFLEQLDGVINGDDSEHCVRGCFKCFESSRRAGSILGSDIRALRGAKPEEAAKRTNGGTFPMLKALLDLFHERQQSYDQQQNQKQKSGGKGSKRANNNNNNNSAVLDPDVVDLDTFRSWFRSDARATAGFIEEILRQILILQYTVRRDELVQVASGGDYYDVDRTQMYSKREDSTRKHETIDDDMQH